MTERSGSSGGRGAAGAGDLSTVLGRMCGLLLSDETFGSILQLVTTLAAATLPTSAGASVTLLGGGAPTTAAATDPLVEEADVAQYELDQGPACRPPRIG